MALDTDLLTLASKLLDAITKAEGPEPLDVVFLINGRLRDGSLPPEPAPGDVVYHITLAPHGDSA